MHSLGYYRDNAPLSGDAAYANAQTHKRTHHCRCTAHLPLVEQEHWAPPGGRLHSPAHPQRDIHEIRMAPGEVCGRSRATLQLPFLGFSETIRACASTPPSRFPSSYSRAFPLFYHSHLLGRGGSSSETGRHRANYSHAHAPLTLFLWFPAFSSFSLCLGVGWRSQCDLQTRRTSLTCPSTPHSHTHTHVHN